MVKTYPGQAEVFSLDMQTVLEMVFSGVRVPFAADGAEVIVAELVEVFDFSAQLSFLPNQKLFLRFQELPDIPVHLSVQSPLDNGYLWNEFGEKKHQWRQAMLSELFQQPVHNQSRGLHIK